MLPARLPSNIVPCRPAHLVYLSDRMREDEREQFNAAAGLETFCPDAAAAFLVDLAQRSGRYAFTILQDNNLPAAAGGFHPAGVGVWQAWMAGTDEGWAQQWRAMTKLTRWAMDRLFEDGAHRIQTSALGTRTKAIEWFERSLGMRAEGMWRGFGIKGEDIAHFSRLRGE